MAKTAPTWGNLLEEPSESACKDRTHAGSLERPSNSHDAFVRTFLCWRMTLHGTAARAGVAYEGTAVVAVEGIPVEGTVVEGTVVEGVVDGLSVKGVAVEGITVEGVPVKGIEVGGRLGGRLGSAVGLHSTRQPLPRTA